ncbi:MAG: hypothetical protein H6810_05920 [Phycisphaeraceae bacterium]|nr:MAG: hypothetical protein H6810_05920 [Phycisphaeraceae bacterium]
MSENHALWICRKCRYDLTDPTGERCPECGRPVKYVRCRPEDLPNVHDWIGVSTFSIEFTGVILVCAVYLRDATAYTLPVIGACISGIGCVLQGVRRNRPALLIVPVSLAFVGSLLGGFLCQTWYGAPIVMALTLLSVVNFFLGFEMYHRRWRSMQR